MAERVSALLPDSVDPARQVEVHTYHGFAAQVLDEGMAVIRFYQEIDGPEPVPSCPIRASETQRRPTTRLG